MFEEWSAAIFGFFVLLCFCQLCLKWCCNGNEEAETHNNAPTNTQRHSEDNFYSMPPQSSPPQALLLGDMSQLERDELPTWLRELTMSQPSNYRSQPIRTAPLNYPENNELLRPLSPRPPYHRTRSYSLEDLPPSYAEATGQTQQATVQPQRHCASEINVTASGYPRKMPQPYRHPHFIALDRLLQRIFLLLMLRLLG